MTSSRRSALRNIVLLFPAFLIIAAMLNSSSCGNPGGIFSEGSSSSSGTTTTTPTATATTTTGSLAFVTNFNDAKVSSFTRNTATGALTHTGQVTAGAKKGPRGLIQSPSGSFLYVANVNDDNIYEFSVNTSTGALTPLSPASVSNGNATEPDQLTRNNSGSLVWATGSKGTVTAYTVDPASGQLTKQSMIGGFNTPFGITLHPTLTVLYVSDTATGLIQPMSYNGSTGALSKNFTAMHSSDVNANRPAAIAIDAAGTSLFVADQQLGEVSSFSIDSTGALAQGPTFQNSSVGDVPVGVGMAVHTGVEFLFTANQGGHSVSSFVAAGTSVTAPPTTAAPYNGPTGMVIDPQSKFVYTADKFDGTVSQSIISGACLSQLCAGPTVATENPANPNSGPFGITIAH